jgi:hypothetical protein
LKFKNSEIYNNRSHKNQTNVDAEKDHLIPGREPTMPIDVEPEHPRQTEVNQLANSELWRKVSEKFPLLTGPG